ncbi:MAG: hypothetical protein ACI8PT_003257 [Gammaproteobacteria bacterium]|jgi:hypothetical protein
MCRVILRRLTNSLTQGCEFRGLIRPPPMPKTQPCDPRMRCHSRILVPQTCRWHARRVGAVFTAATVRDTCRIDELAHQNSCAEERGLKPGAAAMNDFKYWPRYAHQFTTTPTENTTSTANNGANPVTPPREIGCDSWRLSSTRYCNEVCCQFPLTRSAYASSGANRVTILARRSLVASTTSL